jgi:hypothetical protein
MASSTPSPVSGDKRAKLRKDVSSIIQMHGANEKVAERVANSMDSALCAKGPDYTQHARKILFNLPRNADLCRSLALGVLRPADVVLYTPDDFLTPAARESKHMLERKQMEAVDVTSERQTAMSERAAGREDEC